MKWVLKFAGSTTFVTLLLISGLVFADVPLDERAVATGGFGKWLLSVLFESGDLGNMPDQAGIIGAVIQPFSLVCMLVIVVVICVKSVQHVLVVAQAKDVESSPVSMTWAPIHLASAFVLAFPLTAGYSAGQYTAIWIAEQANLLGNLTSEAAIGEGEYSVITQVPMPAVRRTVQGIVDSEVCAVVLNELGVYMASQGGSQIEVDSRELNSSEMMEVAGAPADSYNDGVGYSRKGVVYEVVRIGNLGDFINQPKGINALCGLTIVEHDSYYDDAGAVAFNTDEVGDGSDKALPDGTGGPCPGGMMCTGSAGDPTRSDEKKAIANAFKGAHNRISERFIALKDTAQVRSAVENLTYDVRTYFDALTEPDAQEDYLILQAEERVRVSAAASNIVKAIGDLQTEIYKAYAESIDTLRSKSAATGDSHKDSVLRTGWPALGLYWFQQQSYNSQVLKTTNLTAESRMSVGQLIEIIRRTTGDEEFSVRIANRLSEYRRSVNRQILNTRLDSNPLSRTASGGISNSAQPRDNSQTAGSMRETVSTYVKAMLEASEDNQGATSADGTGWGPSHLFRTTVFPFIVDGLRDDNLVTGLVNTGHNLIVTAEALYGIQLLVRAARKHAVSEQREGYLEKGVEWIFSPFSSAASFINGAIFTSFVGILLAEVMSDLSPLIMYLFFLGLFLAFYLPAVVMVQWIIGLVQWMIYVIEATVVIPLWAILFASDMGQKAFAPETARQGLTHLISILFYPALMVIGFTIGMKVLDVVGTFLIDYIMIGFLGMTTNYSFGIVSVVVGVTLVGVIAYQVIMRVFSGMLELNDRAIGWIGSRSTFGENSSEQATRSAMLAVIGRGESVAGQAGRKKDGDKGQDPRKKEPQ